MNNGGLLNFNKIGEKKKAELVISDMEKIIDQSQYGNTKEKSINHYQIKMKQRMLSALDKNSMKETFAVIANHIE